MRAVYDKRRKLMVELMREVGFGIPVMPQGAFYVFADASKWTDDSYAFAWESSRNLLSVSSRSACRADQRESGSRRRLRPGGQAGSEVQLWPLGYRS
jgi:hypothetical protein